MAGKATDTGSGSGKERERWRCAISPVDSIGRGKEHGGYLILGICGNYPSRFNLERERSHALVPEGEYSSLAHASLEGTLLVRQRSPQKDSIRKWISSGLAHGIEKNTSGVGIRVGELSPVRTGIWP